MRDESGGQVTALRVQEAEMIRSALDQCEGNVADAARRVGINRSTIYRKLSKSLYSKYHPPAAYQEIGLTQFINPHQAGHTPQQSPGACERDPFPRAICSSC